MAAEAKVVAKEAEELAMANVERGCRAAGGCRAAVVEIVAHLPQPPVGTPEADWDPG